MFVCVEISDLITSVGHFHYVQDINRWSLQMKWYSQKTIIHQKNSVENVKDHGNEKEVLTVDMQLKEMSSKLIQTKMTSKN